MSEHTIVGEHRNADVDIERLLAEIAGQPAAGRGMRQDMEWSRHESR